MRVLLTASALTFGLTCDVMASGPVCGDRKEIVADLLDKYDERVQSIGLSTDGSLLEIFASSQGTWTALISTPAGAACVIGAGEAWEHVAKPGAEV